MTIQSPGIIFELNECESRLLADTEFFLCDDSTITVDILTDQIVKEAAALTYKSLQCTGCGIILVIILKVLCEVFDAH